MVTTYPATQGGGETQGAFMKAIVFDRFGGAEVLRESDIEIPEPGAGQVRVRVKAAGVNALDGKVRSGAMQAAFTTPLPAVPGYEFAGVVDAAGEGVTDVQVGDEVVGWADTGSYAEYALATTVARKPSGLDWWTPSRCRSPARRRSASSTCSP